MSEDILDMDIDMLEVPIEDLQSESVVEKEEEKVNDNEDATVRPETIFLHGLDEMSTKDINTYCADLDLKKIEWINDSSCNLVFEDEESATKAIESLLGSSSDPEDPVTHRILRKARAYTQESSGHVFDNLHIRVATTSDIKEPGARDKSRYYLLHGEEPRRSNGSVFDRLGKRNESRPSRRRQQGRRRSLSPQPIRPEEDIKIPDRLKGRIGARRPR